MAWKSARGLTRPPRWALGAMLALASAFAAPAHAASTVRPNTARLAFNDLDGDRLPDSVRYSLSGADHRGYSYLVEFEMSARRHSAPIAVHAADAWGLQIVARDVDGDHDLDLVVTSGSHGQAVDVWINDGQGGFTSAGILGFPVSIWIPEPRLAASGLAPAREVALILSDGWPSAAMPPNSRHPVNTGVRLRFLPAQTRSGDARLNATGPRAPPAL